MLLIKNHDDVFSQIKQFCLLLEACLLSLNEGISVVAFCLRRLVVMFMQFVYFFLFSVFRLTHPASLFDLQFRKHGFCLGQKNTDTKTLVSKGKSVTYGTALSVMGDPFSAEVNFFGATFVPCREEGATGS